MIDATVWEWPQYVYLALAVFGFGVIWSKGEIRMNAVEVTISSIPAYVLLVFGGFFN